MFKAGLVTVSFRGLSPKEIITLAVDAGLELLEWGGDVHVPPQDIENAKQVAAWTKEAGLTTIAYGSYYRLGQNEDPKTAFLPILETAKILEAPIVRIWGGTKGSAELTEDDRAALEEEGRLLVQMAKAYNITLSLECHNNTITDDLNSTLCYLKNVPGMQMYWQPNQFRDEDYNRKAAAELAPYTTNLHVFQWDAQHTYPLHTGEAIWNDYFTAFKGADHGLLLEFMYDHQPSTLKGEAATLLRWIRRMNEEG